MFDSTDMELYFDKLFAITLPLIPLFLTELVAPAINARI